jgi:phosphatidate cytidylyltransferase
VLIPLLLAGLFLLPRAGVAALMGLIIAIGGHEWAKLCGLGPAAAHGYAAAMLASLAALFFVEPAAPAFLIAAAFWLVLVPAWLALGVRAQQHTLLLAAGFLVLVPPALAMLVLRPLDALLVLGVAWIADTAAYFVGRRWGRHKLAPSISPGKTWEGAAGGLVGAAAYAIILSMVLTGGKGAVALVGATALLVVVSILGDLLESAAKRQAGVKDSGAILPGHGGMLDRIDSATAVLPVAAMMMPFLK